MIGENLGVVADFVENRLPSSLAEELVTLVEAEGEKGQLLAKKETAGLLTGPESCP